jgi:hypothetical protein
MPTYYTYKNQIKLKPGERVGFTQGRGYYAVAAPATPDPTPPIAVIGPPASLSDAPGDSLAVPGSHPQAGSPSAGGATPVAPPKAAVPPQAPSAPPATPSVPSEAQGTSLPPPPLGRPAKPKQPATPANAHTVQPMKASDSEVTRARALATVVQPRPATTARHPTPANHPRAYQPTVLAHPTTALNQIERASGGVIATPIKPAKAAVARKIGMHAPTASTSAKLHTETKTSTARRNPTQAAPAPGRNRQLASAHKRRVQPAPALRRTTHGGPESPGTSRRNAYPGATASPVTRRLPGGVTQTTMPSVTRSLPGGVTETITVVKGAGHGATLVTTTRTYKTSDGHTFALRTSQGTPPHGGSSLHFPSVESIERAAGITGGVSGAAVLLLLVAAPELAVPDLITVGLARVAAGSTLIGLGASLGDTIKHPSVSNALKFSIEAGIAGVGLGGATKSDNVIRSAKALGLGTWWAYLQADVERARREDR